MKTVICSTGNADADQSVRLLQHCMDCTAKLCVYSNPLPTKTMGMSQPALAWPKVRYYVEVLVCSRTFDVRKYLSLSLWLSACDWLSFVLWKAGEGTGRGFLASSRVMFWRLYFWISLGEDPWFGWPTSVEDCSFESPWGQANALGMYGQKAVLAW
jgi:hypothetical protein